MIFARPNTYGVDSKIYLIQRYLQNNLLWFSDNGGNLSTYQIRIYGRLYSNAIGESTRPENYVNGNDYEDILNSDKSVVQIAFYVKDRAYNESNQSATMDIIFTVNVNEIFDNNQFETERALFEAEKVLSKCGYINNITDIQETIANVFADFEIDKIKYEDQSPRWVFSFECEIEYTNDTCKTRVTEGTLFTADNNTVTADNNSITVDQILI